MTSSPDQPRDRHDSIRVALCTGAILVVTCATYWRLVAQADFTNWDDSHTVIENPRLAPPTLSSLGWIWSNAYADLYVPVTYTTWWTLARASYTTDARGTVLHNKHVFHTANVALHAAAAVAAFMAIRRLLFLRQDSFDARRADLIASAGALLFALHPVQVEAVGWVSGMKDVLAGLLGIVAIGQYVAYATLQPPDQPPQRRATRYVLALVAFIAAMLSKPSAVVVAPIIVVLDALLLRRRAVDVLRGGIPLLLLTIPIVILGRGVQSAEALSTGVSPLLRPLVATDAIAFYVTKLLAPIRLCVDYGRHPKAAVASGAVWWTWVVPVALGLLAWLSRKRAPLLAAGVVVFMLGLVPVLGFLKFDFQEYSTVADHYLYLPMFGVALAASGALAAAARSRFAVPAAFGTIAVLITLAILSVRQSGFWLGSREVFAHVIAVNPNSWVGHNNLAQATFAVDGDVETALRLVHRSLELRPENQIAYKVLGEILLEKPNPDLPGAIRALAKAVRLQPNDHVARVNLANAYGQAGRFDDAIRQYQAALHYDPSDEKARRMLPRTIAYRDQLRRSTQPATTATSPAASLPSAESPPEGAP